MFCLNIGAIVVLGRAFCCEGRLFGTSTRGSSFWVKMRSRNDWLNFRLGEVDEGSPAVCELLPSAASGDGSW